MLQPSNMVFWVHGAKVTIATLPIIYKYPVYLFCGIQKSFANRNKVKAIDATFEGC